MNWIIQNYETVLIGAYLIASGIAWITPSGKDDTLIQKIGNWADRIGFDLKGKWK